MDNRLRLQSEIDVLNEEIIKCENHITEKKSELKRMNGIYWSKHILENSTDKSIYIGINTHCQYDSSSKPWTNVILNGCSFTDVKTTINYPDSLLFNSELKELILKYINGEHSKESVTEFGKCLEENKTLQEKVKSLETELMRLKVQHSLIVDKFNSLPWYKKITYKIKSLCQ